MDMQRRWTHLCRQMGLSQHTADIWDALRSAYTQPHRRYHTMEHIEYCLTVFDQYKHLADNPVAVEYALWMHDIVYHVHLRPRGLPSNEALSAACADDILALSIMPTIMQIRNQVVGLIMATTHVPGTASTDDERLIADIDWSPLGCSPQKFKENGRALKFEHSRIPDHEFFDNKMRFLLGASRRQSQFYLLEFNDCFGEQAVLNVRNELADLGAPQ